MKYMLVLFVIFLPLSWAESGADSSSTENCQYVTEDVHTVSERSYTKLLTQLTKETESQKKRRRNKRGKGQR